MLKDKEPIKITCPYCGQEYLPAEIFIPNSFFGRPEDIERSYDGKVVDFNGTDMDLKEQYKCDCCGETFNIDTQIKFIASKRDEKYNFNQDYTSEIKIKKYSLFED